jgi:hypothetical protein
VNTDLPGDAGCRGDVLLATGDRALNGQYGEISARYGMSLRWCDARD